ncbi:MAG TPA: hypothetical protein DEB31_04045 [Clostridiales bacterium]|nr:hypothetical protein [Clostridiales bacterium]
MSEEEMKMLCDKCKKNEANVHVSKYINGAVYEQNLCSECAGLETNNLFGGMGGFGNMGNMFEGMREMAMVNAMRGNVGGLYGDRDMEALGLTIPHIEAKREDTETLEGLKKQLKKAVEAQEFEKAAELRDKIYAMEKELTGS